MFVNTVTHRGGRGAWPTRRAKRQYPAYSSAAQRRRPGCIGQRMPSYWRTGVLRQVMGARNVWRGRNPAATLGRLARPKKRAGRLHRGWWQSSSHRRDSRIPDVDRVRWKYRDDDHGNSVSTDHKTVEVLCEHHKV